MSSFQVKPNGLKNKIEPKKIPEMCLPNVISASSRKTHYIWNINFQPATSTEPVHQSHPKFHESIFNRPIKSLANFKKLHVFETGVKIAHNQDMISSNSRFTK